MPCGRPWISSMEFVLQPSARASTFITNTKSRWSPCLKKTFWVDGEERLPNSLKKMCSFERLELKKINFQDETIRLVSELWIRSHFIGSCEWVHGDIGCLYSRSVFVIPVPASSQSSHGPSTTTASQVIFITLHSLIILLDLFSESTQALIRDDIQWPWTARRNRSLFPINSRKRRCSEIFLPIINSSNRPYRNYEMRFVCLIFNFFPIKLLT